ncbi:MAG: TIGR04282 family arsenosugar biosynthesis glycosyltransferase [Rhodanobacter sp.]
MARAAQGKDMTAALAIFVKTPGLSPVKTRLAAALGTVEATGFYRLAAAATAEVVRSCQPALTAYWAIAESGPVAAAAWHGFAQLEQGEGDLGERLDHVYAALQARHGRVLLIGADAPQLTPAMLRAALAMLDDTDKPFVLGDASDGGFWLFGGRAPIPKTVWCAVRYSQAHTASELRALLAPHGVVANAPMLTDVDHATDLPSLAHALTALPDPVPAQRTLHGWLLTTMDRTLLTGTHA